MPKYRVTLMRIDEYVTDVEADNEDDAIDAAIDVAPGLCIHCVGYGRDWSVDYGQWQPASEFSKDNPDVELISE